MTYTLHHGDSLHILAELPDNSVDAVVTDPPYGFAFMGKKWDYDLPPVELWEQVLRVLKPGGHMLAFGGSRTYHRMVCAVEDAGFEIRDCVMWIYGSGFPKSLDISKAIDKAAGAEQEVVGKSRAGIARRSRIGEMVGGIAIEGEKVVAITAPATEAARQWDGWGTALKPAHEPIVLARKPLSERNVAANVLRWGTGGVNVDGTRIGTAADMNPRDFDDSRRVAPKFSGKFNNGQVGQYLSRSGIAPNGRFPANVIHDGSDEVLAGFPVTGPSRAANRGLQHSGRHGGLADIGGNIKFGTDSVRGHDDNGGSAARFFYAAKASRRERNEGLGDGRNGHPTVKPIALMRYLCRLITPPNGIILDPFTGSGTTGCAAMLEGFRFIGIEREAEYVEIARRRIEHWREEADEEVTDEQPELFEAYA